MPAQPRRRGADAGVVTNEMLTKARQSVLGSILISPEIVGEVIQRLSQEDFGPGALGNIYAGIRSLFGRGRPIDPVTLLAEVGNEYLELLDELLQKTPTAANWEAYADIIRDAVQLGKLQAAASRIASATDLAEARKAAEKLSLLLAQRSSLRIVSFADGIREFYERQSEHRTPDYLRWNFKPLDENLFAEPGDLIILGGYPSAGKTLLAAQFAYEMATAQRQRVGIFSLETSDRKLYDRVATYAVELDFGAVKAARLSDSELDAVASLGAKSDRIQLDVIPASGMSPLDIRAVSLSKRYDVIFIDYLQLLNSPGRDRYEIITNTSLALKQLGRDTGITVVALSQLSRPEKGRRSAPTLASLRESGQIEQDADIVMLLYLEDEETPSGNRTLNVAKNKDGELGHFRLGFYPKHMKFFYKGASYQFKSTSHIKLATPEEQQMTLPF